MKLGRYAADLRIIILIPTLAESNAIKHGPLTDTEKFPTLQAKYPSVQKVCSFISKKLPTYNHIGSFSN